MHRSLGIYLREARTGRGLPLEEVATSTRVARRYLEALETDALGELPAPVFTKGYIRAYCQVLGVPAEEALARYEELRGNSTLPAPAPGLSRQSRSRAWDSLVVSVVLLIAFGLGVAVLSVGFPRRDQPTPVAPPTTVAPPAPAATPPAAATPEGTESGRSVEAPGTLQEGKPARLVARTTEPTWISVETDDGRVSQELLPKDATREWTSPNRFIVTIGNAGGVALELNGQPLPRLGASGAVIRKLVLPYEGRAPKP